jgi:hypothetical protein
MFPEVNEALSNLGMRSRHGKKKAVTDLRVSK